MRIAWTTCSKYADLTPDEQVLVKTMQSQGIDVVPVIWDASVDWKQFELVVVRTIWDYHLKIDRYLQWLTTLEKDNVTVLNPVGVLRWNYHKFYLEDLAKKGVPIVKSAFLKKGAILELADQTQHLNMDQLIVKPAISATAHGLLKIDRDQLENPSEEIKALISNNDVIVQEFIEEIQDAGEWSFLFFNNEYSHAVLKKPQKGDFRVQGDYGGTVEEVEPDQSILVQVGSVVSKIEQKLLYCRVDGMVLDGQFTLMELELIEPELFLKTEAIRTNFSNAIQFHL